MTVTLDTPRLHLRRPSHADAAAGVAFLMSERSRFMGGPMQAEAAATDYRTVCDLWDANGFSLFVITRQGDDTAIGLAGPWQPAGFEEPEIGWNLWNHADEGQGIATEAVSAARDWAFGPLGLRTAVSYIHPDNHRSARLAERVGASRDLTAFCPYPPPVLIYRHVAGQAA